MTKNISLWKKFLICVLGVLMITTLAFGVVTITAKAEDRTYSSAEFQSFLQYTKIKAENGQDAYVITGFEYIAGDGEKGIFGTSETNPVVIPASYARAGEEALPVIGIAQGVFAGYPLQYVKFEQIERKVGENDAIFEKLSKFVLVDKNDGWSFTVTGADYGTAMLSIGGYNIDGTKLSDDIINGDAEYLSGVFQGCQDLKTIVLPGTVQEMGPGIFNQSTVVNVKSTTTLGGLTVNDHSFTVFGSMQGLLYLKRIPYRAFYYSQKLTTLVFPDYAEAAESRFVRANYNQDDKINGENLFHAHEEDGNYYFVPMYGGSGVADRTDSNKGETTNPALKTLNEHAGLKELGEEAFYNTTAIANTALTSNDVEGFYDIDTNKIKPKRLYFAGITKMGGESMQKVSNVDYDMGKYVAPGTVEGIPGGDISVGRVAWSPYAPYYASYNYLDARYVVNASTGKVSGFHVQWTTSNYAGSNHGFTDPDATINIPSEVSSFTRINDVYGDEIEKGKQPTVIITGISGGAFAGITANDAAGKTLTFENGIEMTEIGASTFRANKYITTINNLPDTIEKIAYHAFEQSTITKVTTSSTSSSTSGVDSSVINGSTFIMPLNIKQIDHRAFRSATSLQRIYFPGSGDNGTFDINATAFTESKNIKDIYFAGYNGSSYQQIIPNQIKNWPWSANNAKMHYNRITTGIDWTDLAAAFRQDDTELWDIYYNPANPDEAYLMGVNWNNLKTAATTPSNKYYSQACEWYTAVNWNDYGEYANLNKDCTYDLKLPETLIVGGHEVRITGIGAPQGDVNFFADDTGVKINKLTIPKYAREVTTATFRADKTGGGTGNKLSINILEFDWDIYDEDNTGVQYIRISAFGFGCGIRYLHLPEYSLKKIERTAFSGHSLQQETLVIPGNTESVDPTAFNDGTDVKVQKIYVMQYSTTPSDGSYNLMAGKYNNFGLNGAGSMGLKTKGSATPVYFVDQFRPEYYEIGQVDNKWQALVAHKGSADNPGAYDLPYITDGATPQYVHPILDANGNFTGEVEIRFGVRLLLQHDMGRVTAVDSLNSSGGLSKAPQTEGANRDDPLWGTDFYFVYLKGITKNGTYNFRVEFRNEKLVDALVENHFHHFTGLKFVNEFSIDVNVFSTVTFSHALAMTIDDSGLLPSMQTSDGTVALYSGNSYAYYYDNNVKAYRRDDANTKSVTSKIHLDSPKEGTFSNAAYAEFIGWTTDTALASSLQLEIPADYSGTNTDSIFFKAGQNTGDNGKGYPLDVLLGEGNTTNNARLYSVFRYVINHGVDLYGNGLDETLSWIYGENPITSKYVGTDINSAEQNGRIATLPVNVTGGYLTLVKIENGEQRAYNSVIENEEVYNSVQVRVGEFNNALGTILSPSLPVGEYKLYGGKREGDKKIADLSPITARFKVEKLGISVVGTEISEYYGEHNKDDATIYVAGQVAISPKDNYIKRVSVVPDDHDSILALSTNFNSKDKVYPGVGTYTYTYTLAAGENYDLTEDTNAEITYKVTQRPIEITAAGLVTDNTDITQPNSRTYSWTYNGKNFNTNYYNTFVVSNYADGENWETVPAYKYVWYKEEIQDGKLVYVEVSDSNPIKDAGNYRLYIQWTDCNYIIDAVNRTVHGAASAEGNRIKLTDKDANGNLIYNVLVCDVEIYRATLTVTVTNNTFTYNGEYHGADVVVKVTAVNEAESFTLTGDDDLAKITNINVSSYKFKDAGTHTVSYSLVSSILGKGYLLNYNPIYNETYEVIINAAQITVSSTATQNFKEYDGKVFEYGFEFTAKTANALDGNKLPHSGNTIMYQFYIDGVWGNLVDATKGIQPKDVGNYIVRVYVLRGTTIESGSNYIIKESESELYFEYSFSITAYDLSKKGADRVSVTNNSSTFNAANQNALPKTLNITTSDGNALSLSAFDSKGEVTDKNGNKLTLLYSYNGLTWLTGGELPDNYRNAGEYTIYFRISAANYVTYEGHYIFEIKRAEFTAFIASTEKIEKVYDRNSHGTETTISFKGLEGDTEFNNGFTLIYKYSTDGDGAWLTSPDRPTFVHAGTYTVSYTVSHINYCHNGESGPFSYEYTVVINQAKLTFQPSVKQFVYNGSEQGVFPLTTENLVNGDSNTAYQLQFWTTDTDTPDAKDVTTDMPTKINAGIYTVRYKVVAGGDYYSDVCNYTLIITPAEIKAEAYDSTLIYNGAAQYSGVRFTPTIRSLPPTVVTGNMNFNGATKLYVYEDEVSTVKVAGKTYIYTLTLRSGENDNYTDADTYYIDVEFGKNGNFAFVVNERHEATYTGSYSFEITPAVVRLKAFDSATFNSAPQGVTPAFELNSNITIEKLNPTWDKIEYRLKGTETWSEDAPVNAGEYEVRVTLNNGNYTFANGLLSSSLSYTIDRFNLGNLPAGAKVEVALEDGFYYTGSSIEPKITGYTITFVNGKSLTYSSTNADSYSALVTSYYSNNVDAGINTAIAYIVPNPEQDSTTISNSANFRGTLQVTFTILQRELGFTSIPSFAGDNYEEIEAALANISSDDIDNNDEFIVENGLQGNTYGYVYSYSPAIVHKVNGVNRTLTEGTHYTVIYFYQAFGGNTWKHVANINDIINAGTYRAVIEAKFNDITEGYKTRALKTEYTGNYCGIFISEFIIDQVEISVSAETSSFVYNGEQQISNVLFSNTSNTALPADAEYVLITTAGKYTYESVNGFFNSDNGFKNVGNYTVTVKLVNENGNFNFVDSVKGNTYEQKISWQITPAVITLNSIDSATYNMDVQEPTLGFSEVTGKIVADELIKIAGNNNIAFGYSVSYKANNNRGTNAEFANGTDLPVNADTYTVTVMLGKWVTRAEDGKTTVQFVEGGNYLFLAPGSSSENTTKSFGEYIINPFDISELKEQEGSADNCDIIVNVTGDLTYTGSAIRPDVSVTVIKIGNRGNVELTQGNDYSLQYERNVNIADDSNIVITGIGNYTGTRDKEFSLTPASLGTITVNGSGANGFTFSHDKSNPEGANDEHFSYDSVDESYIYSGAVRNLSIALVYDYDLNESNNQLQTLAGTDFIIQYYVNCGNTWKLINAADVKDTGEYRAYLISNSSNYVGSYLIDFKVTPAHIRLVYDGTNNAEDLSYIYNGRTQQPNVMFQATDEFGTLPNHSDYIIKYGYSGYFGETDDILKAQTPNSGKIDASNNFRNAGKYSVTVTLTFGTNGYMNFIWATCNMTDCSCLEDDGLTCRCQDSALNFTIEETTLEVGWINSSSDYTGSEHDLQNNVIFTNGSNGGITPGNVINSYGSQSLDNYVVVVDDDYTKMPVNVGKYNAVVYLFGYSIEQGSFKKEDGRYITGGNFNFGLDEHGKPVYVLGLSYEITPAIIDVSAVDPSYVYNGDSQRSNVVFSGATVPETININGGNTGDNGYYTVTGANYTLTFDGYTSKYFTTNGKSTVANSADYKNVGDYTVTVTLVNGGNFAFGIGEKGVYIYTSEYTYSITPLTVSADLLQSVEYNAQDQKPENISFIPGTPAVDGYKVFYADNLGISVEECVNAGDYTVTVWLLTNLYENPSGSETAQSYLYGGNFAFNRSGNENYYYSRSLKFTITSFKFIDDEYDASGSIIKNQRNVLLYDGDTLLSQDDEYVYNSNAWTPVTSAVVKSTTFEGGQIDLTGDDYTITYYNNINSSDTGLANREGYARATVNGIGNYTGSVTVYFIINPKSLKEAASEGTENADITYTGINNVTYTDTEYSYAALTVSYNGRSLVENTHYNVYYFENKVANPVVNGRVTGNIAAPKNAGTYYLLVSAVANGNYADYFWIEFTITPAEVMVVASGVTQIEYDSEAHKLDYYFVVTNSTATLRESDYMATYSYDGSAYGFSISDGYRNSGTYTLKIELIDLGARNFKFVEDNGVAVGNSFTYDIYPRTVTAQLTGVDTYYDSTSKEAGVIFTNFGVQPTSGQYSLSYSDGSGFGVEHVNAGTYYVKVELLSNNFRFLSKSATGNVEAEYSQEAEITTSSGEHFVIRPSEINVYLTNSSSTYDGNEVELKNFIRLANASGTGSNVLPDMDNVSVYYGTYVSNTHAVNAGQYYISLIINDGRNSNHDSTNFIFRLTGTNTYYSEILETDKLVYIITPARLSLGAFASPTYNGKEQAVEITFFNEHGEKVMLGLGENYVVDYAVDVRSNNTNAKLGANGIPLNAGTYRVTVTLVNEGGYGNYMFGIDRESDTLAYTYKLYETYVILTKQITLADIKSVGGEGIETNPEVSIANGRYYTTYDGTEKKPLPDLQVNLATGVYTLEKDSDYSLTYENNINSSYSYRMGVVNSPYLIVTGNGNYSGEVSLIFRIYQANLSFTLEENYAVYNGQPHYSIAVKSFANVIEGGPAPKVSEASYSMLYYTMVDGVKTYVNVPTNSGTYYVEITLDEWEGNYYVVTTNEANGRPHLSQEEYAEYAFYIIGQIRLTVTIENDIVFYLAMRQTATVTISDADDADSRMPVLGTDYKITYAENDSDNALLKNGEPYNAGKYLLTVTLSDFAKTNYIIENVVIGGTENKINSYTLTADFTINKALVEAYVVGASATYDASEYYLTERNMLFVRTVSGVNIYNYENLTGSSVTNQTDIYRVMYEAMDGAAMPASGHPINAGKYNVTITLSSNFEWNRGSNGFVNGSHVVVVDSDSVASFNFTVNPAIIHADLIEGGTVTYKNAEFTASDYINVYNPTNPALVPKLDFGDSAINTYTVSADDRLFNAGSYKLTVTINGGNFLIFIAAGDNVSVNEYDFTITPSIIKVNYKNSSRVYTGEEWILDDLKFTNTNAVTDPAYADVLPTSDDYTLSTVGDLTNVGVHSVTLTLLSNGNFSFEKVADRYVYETVVTYTITQAKITVNTEEGSWFYGRQDGDEIQSGYSVTEFYRPYGEDYEGAYKLILTSDSFKLVDGTAAKVTVTDISTYGGTYAVDSNNNYVMLTVGRYYINVQVEDTNGNHETVHFTVVVEIVNNSIIIVVDDVLSDVYGTNFKAEELSERLLQIVTAIKGVPGYSDSDNSAETLEAKKNWLTSVGFSISLVNAEYSSSDNLAVGLYGIRISLGDSNNSVIFEATSSDTQYRLYSITPREISIDWGAYFGDNAKNYIYDGYDVNYASTNDGRVTEQALELFYGVQISNRLGRDDVKFITMNVGSLDRNNQYVQGAINVGEYLFRVSGLNGGDARNYTFPYGSNGYAVQYLENTFNIARRVVDVSLANSTSVYGDLTYNTKYGYIYVDTILERDSALSTTVDLTDTVLANLYLVDSEGKVVGSNVYPGVGKVYTIKYYVSSIDYDMNFTLNFVAESTHTVTAKSVTVTANVSGIYGDPVANVEDIIWSASGLANGESEDMLNIIFRITVKSAVGDDNGVWLNAVGDYNVGVFAESICLNANYDVTFIGTYTLAPRPITVTPESGESVYGEELPVLDGWSWKISEGNLVFDDSEESLIVSFEYYGLSDNSILPNVGDTVYIRGTVGKDSNPNYLITFNTEVKVTILPRTVKIIVGKDEGVYGTVHVGDRLTLTEGKAMSSNGLWKYEVIGDGYYSILPDDISNLTFFLAQAQDNPEILFAPVGTYELVGVWGYGLSATAAARRNYDVEITGGQFKVTLASIYEGSAANWTRTDIAYKQGEEGDYTEESGWYGMAISPSAYIILAGDYTLTGDNVLTFNRFVEDGTNVYIEYVAYVGKINADDKGVIIRYYLPEFTAADSSVGQYHYDEDTHTWLVHSAGTWKMNIEVIQANHITAMFTLTYVISPVHAFVSLRPAYIENGQPFKLQYHEYVDIEELNDMLWHYVFGSDYYYGSRIIGIDGLQSLGGTIEVWYQWLMQYFAIEVVTTPDNFSSTGRLKVGTYDIALVQRVNCGFTASFQTGDTDGTGRLVIGKTALSIIWAEDEFEEDGTQIVTVGEDQITYLYTGAPYSQAPKFGGIVENDGILDKINAPVFEYRLGGDNFSEPRNVLAGNGTYTVYVYPALSGADSENYSLPEVLEIALRIIPREVTVTIGNEVSTYGDYSDEDIVQMLLDVEKYTHISWLGEGDNINSLNVVLSKAAGLNAGDYVIIGSYSNLNYSVTFKNGTYTVSPKEITVKIGNIERTFGDDIADLNANYTAEGVLEGETLNIAFEIAGATYYYIGEYLEVSDNEAGYAIIGKDLDTNYEVIFVGDWSDGKSGIYKVNKAQNDWIQWFLFDYIVEGEEPFIMDLPIAYYGPTVIEYYYDEDMTERVEVSVSELLEGTYYAKACVYESKNYTGLAFRTHVFDVVSGFIPHNRNVDIIAIVILLTVEMVVLTYGLIFVRRRKENNNN